MTDILRGFAKMLIMLLPFLVLCLANAWANLRREIRYKQFLMPFAAVLITLVAMYLLTDIHDQSEELLRYVIRELERFAGWLTRNTRLEPGSFALWLRDSVQKLTEWIREQNLTYWAFYVANALILLGYILIKQVCLLLMRGLFRDGSIFQKLAGMFYEYDENTGLWHLMPKFGQGRTFLKSLYIVAIALGAAGILTSSKLYLEEKLTAPFYPVFIVIILGEAWFFLHGLTRKEYRSRIRGEAPNSRLIVSMWYVNGAVCCDIITNIITL